MKNSTKDYLKKVGIRAFHTFWQTMVPMIPVGVMVTEIEWKQILFVCLGAVVLSVAKSFAVGVPEAEVVSDISDEEAEALKEASEVIDDE